MHPSSPPDPLAVVSSWLAAVERRDVDAVLALTHPDLEYVRWRGVERGHDAVLGLLHRQSFGVVMRPTLRRAFRRGDTLALGIDLESRHADTGEALPGQAAGAVVGVRDGLVARVVPCPDLPSALRIAGFGPDDEIPSVPADRSGARGSIVAVHGATGVQGRALARRLVAAGHHVLGLARTPRPAGDVLHAVEPVAADLRDSEALARAYTGADAVVVQLPLVPEGSAMDQAKAVAVALRRAEVPRVVFLTAGRLPPVPVGDPFFDARLALARALEGSRADVCVIEPAAPYMENLSAPWSAPLVAGGVLAYPLPAELPIPWVTLEDVAEHVAAAVVSAGGGRITLCGPSAPTGPDAAAALERALGRPVRWETLDPVSYGEMVRPHLGDGAAKHVAKAYAALLAGPPPPPPDPASVRLGRTDLTTWARGHAWQRPAGLDQALAPTVAT